MNMISPSRGKAAAVDLQGAGDGGRMISVLQSAYGDMGAGLQPEIS